MGNKITNPKRKLKYTLEIIEDKKSKVGVNTHSTNEIVFDALKNGRLTELTTTIILREKLNLDQIQDSIF